MTTTQSRTLYDKYLEVTEGIAKLEAEKKELTEKLFAKMDAEKIDKVEGDRGLIVIATRAKWVYSSNVEKAAGDLKELKKVEEKTGVAVKEETRYLTTRLR